MTWGGIQNESRPMMTCHWMSHCTPQPPISLETRRPQRAARRTARAASGPTAVPSSCSWVTRRAISSLGDRRNVRPARVALSPTSITVAECPALVNLGRDTTTRGLTSQWMSCPADVLRLVPGLVISQHQGGGKAEQYFLRGFVADHGTDIALFVDGLPVNLRSHAHGQGYADLHFLIPETVARLDGFKGPYFVEYGDFATAGAVNFVMRDTVDENYAEAAGGSFATQRYLTLLSPTRDALKTLVALEYYRSDGPFTHPNGYERFNFFAKAKASLSEGMDLSLWGSYYQADWHGSGEIPARAVRAGLIGRFDAIDPNEGGNTQRANLNLDWRWRVDDSQLLAVHA